MKRSIWKKAVCVLLCAAALFSLASCTQILFGKSNVDELGSERVLQIKKTYMETLPFRDEITIDDVSVIEYCGTYDDCSVLMLTTRVSVYAQALWTEEVAGSRFGYSDSNRLYAWKDGRIYTLPEAYEAGLLSEADLKTIRSLHNAG